MLHARAGAELLSVGGGVTKVVLTEHRTCLCAARVAVRFLDGRHPATAVHVRVVQLRLGLACVCMRIDEVGMHCILHDKRCALITVVCTRKE